MSLPTLQKHYLRVLRLWPIDHLRGLTFQDAFRRRLETRFLLPAASPTTQYTNNNAMVAPTKDGVVATSTSPKASSSASTSTVSPTSPGAASTSMFASSDKSTTSTTSAASGDSIEYAPAGKTGVGITSTSATHASQNAPSVGSGRVDETREQGELNALYSLLENRYSKQYETSEKLYRPGFNPDYYENLANEMEAARHRTWLQRKWLRLSQVIRFT